MPRPTLPKETRAYRRARLAHINLLIAASRFTDDMDQACRAAGLTMQQYTVLWVLCFSDKADQGVPMGVIADGLVNRASDTTRMVDRMVQAGLADRRPSPTDRRVVLVRATAAGRRAFGAAVPAVMAFHRHQWANLTTTEIDTLHHLIAKTLWGSDEKNTTTIDNQEAS